MARDRDHVLRAQIEYYQARAGEYDEWFYRLGRYDHGEELNRQWFAEVEVVQTALYSLAPLGQVLELATGTGIWTEQLIGLAEHVTALDASAEVIEINRHKTGGAGVTYRQQDVFAWEPDREYDCVFFSFWLSHVPPEQLDPFLDKVRRATRPGGRFFLIDSRYEQTGTAKDNPLRDEEHIYRTRTLNDGREYQIVKVFYEPDDLQARLADHGFDAEVKATDHYFIYGTGERRS